MKRNASILFAGLLVILLSTTAWADLDPRADFGDCGFTSTEETWEPDTGGTLMKRVIYVSECDTPSAGEETITITTEEWNGSALELTEVREAVRTVSSGIYFTTTLIYDGSMALQGKEDHTYDLYQINTNIWFQEWTFYTWEDPNFVLAGYTTRNTELLGGDDRDVTYIYYDTTFRADPVIPDDVPVLGSSTSNPMLPPLGKNIDHIAVETLGRMYERVRNTLIVNPNTPQEAYKMVMSNGGEPISHLCSPPPGVYVKRVLKADRTDDPAGPMGFNGFWARWVSFDNTVGGDLLATFGWTSDRDLNEFDDDYWQARVKQNAAGALQYIENAHRVGFWYDDHYDTYTLLNSMFMIESQTVKVFDYDEGNPGNFIQVTNVSDSMSAPVSYTTWTVVYN